MRAVARQREKFAHDLEVRKHQLTADEPEGRGGEDGGLGAAVDVDVARGLGREQRAAQLLGECGPGPQASSTRSSNRTSPSSVRWTGHLAAITRRRSTCSWLSESGRRRMIWKRVGQPRSAGE